MNGRQKKVGSRSALIGGIVLVILGAYLVWVFLTGVGAGGDVAYFTVLLVLGGSMIVMGSILWFEVRQGGATRSTDTVMILVQVQVLSSLAWLAFNTEMIQVIQITNGEVSFTGVHENIAIGFALLMLLSVYDILSRLYRWNERATLNTAPRLTGPDI